MSYPRVILKSGKDASLRRYHPWVFSGAIKKVYGNLYDGCWAEVFDNKDEYLGSGQYQNGSIALRILTFEREEPGRSLYLDRIRKAWQYREMLGLAGSDKSRIFRLVHAEGDGLPGLIIDLYGSTAVLQMHSLGMYHDRDLIVEALQKVLGNRLQSVYNKSSNSLPPRENLRPEDAYLLGAGEEEDLSEYGYRFRIDWQRGQKTGFFIDQRENRRLLEHYAAGRRVLNMFCYTGGFSVYALKAASEVVSVDSSGHAIDLTRENVALNYDDTQRHEALVADAFDYLSGDLRHRFDLIVLDPPAFAKHHRVMNHALQGYKRLNQRALECISPGGLLFTFSCSQVVSRENFRKSVFVAAANVGRKVRIMHQLTQPADHPVSLYHPEGEYLKGLVVHVE